MIVLDTNVVSEMMKASPDKNVETWLSAQPAGGMFITTITEAELRYGIALLPTGRRRDRLAEALEAMLLEDFVERILAFDSSAAIAYAMVASERRSAGRPIAQFDAQIAGIVKSRGASLATRNIADFENCGISVINPWG